MVRRLDIVAVGHWLLTWLDLIQDQFPPTDCGPAHIAEQVLVAKLRPGGPKTLYDAEGWLLTQRKPNDIKHVYEIPRATHFAHHGDSRQGFDFLPCDPARPAQASVSEKVVPM